MLNDTVGIERGLMTTIHAYTADQRLQDMPHKDLRRARAAAINLIPTSTGAAKAVGLVLPDLEGKLSGISVRAPVITGSLVDLTCDVSKETSDGGDQRGDEGGRVGPPRAGSSSTPRTRSSPPTSSPIPHSSIFDAEQTKVVDGTFVKLLAWYDNEWGYAEPLRRSGGEGAAAGDGRCLTIRRHARSPRRASGTRMSRASASCCART